MATQVSELIKAAKAYEAAEEALLAARRAKQAAQDEVALQSVEIPKLQTALQTAKATLKAATDGL